MKSLIAVIAAAVAFCAAGVYAADRTATAENECRAVLNENFNAIVYENADALLATISPATGTREQFAEFRQEAEKMFDATDVYMHVVAFKVEKYSPPFLDALVVQQTTPKSENDYYPLEQGKLNFRHKSGLLPEHKLVVYRQRFHRVNGKWKLHLVLSEPEPIDAAGVQALTEKSHAAANDCANGQCTPFVKVR